MSSHGEAASTKTDIHSSDDGPFPAEIWAEIASYLRSRNDLCNLSLASRIVSGAIRDVKFHTVSVAHTGWIDESRLILQPRETELSSSDWQTALRLFGSLSLDDWPEEDPTYLQRRMEEVRLPPEDICSRAKQVKIRGPIPIPLSAFPAATTIELCQQAFMGPSLESVYAPTVRSEDFTRWEKAWRSSFAGAQATVLVLRQERIRRAHCQALLLAAGQMKQLTRICFDGIDRHGKRNMTNFAFSNIDMEDFFPQVSTVDFTVSPECRRSTDVANYSYGRFILASEGNTWLSKRTTINFWDPRQCTLSMHPTRVGSSHNVKKPPYGFRIATALELSEELPASHPRINVLFREFHPEDEGPDPSVFPAEGDTALDRAKELVLVRDLTVDLRSMKTFKVPINAA